MTLLGSIVRHLEERGVPCALIGGAALAYHGVARATEDLDLLVADRRVLEPAFWEDLGAPGAPEIRRGDAEDPLGGVVAWRAAGSPLDVVVGRDAWLAAALGRRIWTTLNEERIPVLDAADLVLTKLAAGGPQDLLDVKLLLAGSRADLRAQVEERLRGLPSSLREAWPAVVT